MSEIDEALQYTFRWYTHWDNRVCVDCRSLNAQTWHDQDLFAPHLIDDVIGPVWDLDADRSLMHADSGTCRCRLEVTAKIDLGAIKIYGVLREGLQSVAQ